MFIPPCRSNIWFIVPLIPWPPTLQLSYTLSDCPRLRSSYYTPPPPRYSCRCLVDSANGTPDPLSGWIQLIGDGFVVPHNRGNDLVTQVGELATIARSHVAKVK